MQLSQKTLVSAEPIKFGAALPALKSLLETLPAPRSQRCIVITHVLETAVSYIQALNSVFVVEKIIAIPYSANPEAVRRLTNEGFKVIVPDGVEATFQVSEQETLSSLEASTVPLLVQEVGGYLAHCSATLARHGHFLGVVEDTNNGHWLYERTEPHPIPVLSMAQSPLKAVEDSIIGDAIVHSLERILRDEFASITQGIRAGVVGFGKIGRSTAFALKGREAVVSLYDINPAKNMAAQVEGFYPMPLKKLLMESDVVVGCTGQTSIRLVDAHDIKNGAILVSGSSKNVEFALDDFAQAFQLEKLSDLIWKYTTPQGKHFYVLHQGTPVNFRDGSILGTILDMIYCELFVCMREISKRSVPAGLHKSPPEIQNEVAKAWIRQHAETFSEATEDKIWTYPDSLKLGLPQTH